MPSLNLISHPLCPHLQRLVLIALAGGWERDRNFKVTYLPYPTFLEEMKRYSPAGQGPVLQIDGKTVSTTTEHIGEYIDLLTGRKLLPSDAPTLLRVREREKVVRVTLDVLRGVFTAKTQDDLTASMDSLFVQLHAIDSDLRSDNTTEHTVRMDMASLAPMFSLMSMFPYIIDSQRWSGIPRLQEIAKGEATHPIVVESRCPHYAQEFDAFFLFSQSNFPHLIENNHSPEQYSAATV